MATDGQIASIPQILHSKPLVYVDRSPLHAQVDSVLVDNAQAAYEATEHLLKLGHRRIAVITEPLNLLNAADRLSGYKQALRDYRVRVEPKLIRPGENTQESGYWHALEIFKAPSCPTAVLACNNRMLLGMFVALRELGLACPRDVSLVGFDDFDWSAYISPPLTIVHQPAAELGATAAKTVLKRVRHPDRDHHEKTLLPTQLIVRQSTCPLRESR
jgi:LacI family transcriptional regulator